MDETWVWRYHSTKRGVAPKGTGRGGVKSGKGERLIVIDAITKDGALRSNDNSAMWAYLYSQSGDYHDAMNFDKFQNWIQEYLIPVCKDCFPESPITLVLDNATYHLGGMINPFSLSKKIVCHIFESSCLLEA